VATLLRVLIICSSVLVWSDVRTLVAEPTTVDFQRDVRPILSDRCYPCHGPDAKERKARLRLDTKDGAFRVRRGESPIVPGKPQASELLRRVATTDDDERMPPPESGPTLRASEVEILRQWIASGAKWDEHWAFRPVAARAESGRVDGATSFIDDLVRRRLAREGLESSPRASRETLIRRVTLDLTGLPPSVEEIDAFLADERPDAYSRLVDRLLASDRCAERLALDWLDAARYADTNGYQTDGERSMWRWRDWVIDAFRTNKPFDEFTIEQLAGDLLPDPSIDQLIATGFHRNHRGNGEGGVIPEEYLVEYVVDRVDTTASVWLGLTLGCARCHDHKYDPFSQREFYEFFAYFHNVPEMGRTFKYGNSPPFVRAPTLYQKKKLAEADAKIRRAAEKLGELDAVIERDLAAFEKSLRSDKKIVDANVDRGALVKVDKVDAPFVDSGDVAAIGFYDKFTWSAWVSPARADAGTVLSRMLDVPRETGYALRVEGGAVHVNLVRRWLDDSIRVRTTRKLEIGKLAHVLVLYDGSRMAAGVRVFVDGKEWKTVADLDELNQPFDVMEPFRVGRGGGEGSVFRGAIDRVRVFDRVVRLRERRALTVRASLTGIVRKKSEERSATERDKLRLAFLDHFAAPSIRKMHESWIEATAARESLVDSFPTVMVMQERKTPRETHVLDRGRYDEPRERVLPNVPAILSTGAKASAEGQRATRLDLARWIVSRDNPLTARVTVNRFWQMLFGAGLVATPNDFGSQGEAPSHPELLDALAREFVESGWNVRHVLRTIVLSETYRQSSRVSPAGLARDPNNRWLSRGPRLRLSAHAIRDQVLAISGLLSEKLGGPSVKPYQPPGLWEELSGEKYQRDGGDALYRRSLYTFWKRTAPPPAMMAFDAAGRETYCVRTTRTNTPLQALVLLNDITYVEAARVFATKMMRKGGESPRKRIAWAFRRATGRHGSDREIAILEAGLARHLEEFGRNANEARRVVELGDSKAGAKLGAAELAAYTLVASVILNLDEVLTRE